MVETLRVMRDMRQEMGDMQTELLSLRGQRRARLPAPDVRIPDHHDASGDVDNHQNSINGDASHSLHGDDRRNVQTARPCYYANFKKCQPLNFKGTEGVVGLARWIEKMESVFNISGCAIENQIKFATCTLLGAALTWWNGQIRTLGPEAYAMTWEGLKKKMTDKYFLLELTLICTKFCANETEKINKYIRGLPITSIGIWECREERECIGKPRLQCHHGFLIDIVPTPLDNSYDVELADGKIVGIDTIIQGCTLNFLDHPFNIDLMPVELGSFDVIIGMDCSNERESRLTVISCSKAQEYMAKGCQVFLAEISAKKEEDKSEGKQLKDVPAVRDFPEVFPEDLSGLPPARPVEFQINLIPGAAPVARAPYRSSEMKNNWRQLQELSRKRIHKA
ncbi:hypothetical protein Tco_0735139 [Tanacetum coccineum]